MKYSIDKIENNIVLLEELNTGEKIEVLKQELPSNIHEGSIIVKNDNMYEMDLLTEKQVRKDIKSRFNKLKKKNK